jgi:hypothetical protein
MIEIPLRQSWLNTFDMCPERARQERLGLVKGSESSDTMRGTAVHAGIEHCGLVLLNSGQRVDVAEGLDVVDATIQALAPTVEMWRDSLERVTDVARVNFEAWHRELFPQLHPTGVEDEFRVTLDERDGVRLVLTGTADWMNEDGTVWDWKNPSRHYKPWEKKRWDIQSHVYCFAFGATKFNLGVIAKGDIQVIEIERTEGHIEALKDMCWAIADMIQSDLKVWPQRWSGWHCSPVWCPVWQAGECRGKHLGSDPW